MSGISKSFATTHAIVKELMEVEDWTRREIDMLLDIAIKRHPVRYLLNDEDVKTFYKKIIGMLKSPTAKAKRVTACFNED